jgi:hypothetical protein
MSPQAKSRVIDARSVLLFVVLGLIGLALDLRWYLNPYMMMVDGAIATGLGFLSIFKQRFGKLRRGTAPTLDPTQASAGVSSDFRTALFLIMLGSALVLLGKSTVDTIFP